MTAVEHVAQIVLAEINPSERELDSRDHIEATLRCVGDGRKPIDGTDVEGKIRSADTGDLGGEHKKVGAVDQRRKAPREEQWEAEIFRRWLVGVGEGIDLVFEGEHHAWVDLEGKVEIEWPTARMLWVEVHLECLTHRVRLDEVPLIMNMEAVMGCMIFQVGDETCDIDDRHDVSSSPSWGR